MVSVAQAAIINRSMLVANIAVYCYDFLVHIPAEIQFYWRRGIRAFTSPVVILFALIRYVSLLLGCLALYTNLSEDLSVCNWGARTFQCGVFFVQICVNMVLLLRVYAITNRNRYLCGGLFVVGIASLIPGIEYIVGVRRRTDVEICAFRAPQPWHLALFSVIQLVYDILVFGICFRKLWKSFHRVGFWSPIAKMLMRDGAIYFAVAVVCSGLSATFQLLPRSTRLLGIGITFTWLLSITAQRVVLHHLTDFHVGGSYHVATSNPPLSATKGTRFSGAPSVMMQVRSNPSVSVKSPTTAYPITSPVPAYQGPTYQKEVYVHEEYDDYQSPDYR